MGLVGSGAAKRKETNSYQPLRLRTGGATWGMLPTTYMLKSYFNCFKTFPSFLLPKLLGFGAHALLFPQI